MIILATTSPRRIEIFNRMGVLFSAVPPNFDESSCVMIDPIITPVDFAYKKAISISEDYPNDLLIGFDTIVFLKGKILGKPKSMDEAMEFLEEMSGAIHEVITGVAMVCIREKINYSFSEISRVKFKPLTNDIISEYFQKINPLDKAGAYSAQEHRNMIIESIEGSENNVLGVPTEKLLKELSNLQNRVLNVINR